MIEVRTKCPICGKSQSIELTDDQYKRLQRYFNHEGLIQDMLPELTASAREMLKSGICDNCWSDMFGGDDDE